MAQQQAASEYQTERIPLAGMMNTREFDSSGSAVTGPTSGTVGIGVVGQMVVHQQLTLSKDQRFINCIPTQLKNELTEKKQYYLLKRPGFEQNSVPSTGNPGKYILYWGIKVAGASIVTAWKNTNSEIFDGVTSLGSISGECIFLMEITLGTTSAFIIQSSDNTLWYYVESTLGSFVGSTHTSTTIDSIASTTNLHVGQLITGSGIQVGTRIATIASSTSITITLATTTTAAGITITSEPLAKIVDTDYPGNMTPAKTVKAGAVFLDGYLFVMDKDGIVYNSDLNSVVNWSADGSIQSNSYPDKGITLVRYRNLVAAFNTTSLEFFSDAGNPSGTPLVNNTQATIKIGAASSYGVATVEDTMVWVSSSDKGGASVYLLEFYRPNKISTPIIDQQIALVGADTAKINAVKFFGRTFIFLVLTNNTFVYCVEDKMWHEWSSVYNYWDFLVAASSGVNHIYGISIASDAGVAGQVWKLNVSTVVYTDNGGNYTMTIQTSKLDSANNLRKRASRLSIIGDKQTVSSNMDISWSDDDYQTFSTTRSVDMSSNRPYINNCGKMYRRRAYRLVNTAPSGQRLEAIELDTIQGVN